MKTKDALTIVQVLAAGVDPVTGEVFPNDSPYQTAEVTRALLLAVESMKLKIKADSRKANLPANAGGPWTKEEDREVAEKFDKGMSVQDISQSHGRTYGAIMSRLTKLGKRPIGYGESPK